MPTWPFQTAASTTETLVGSDDANNEQATTNVVANADGSVLERLEYLQSAQAVPTADAATDTLARDVIGIKTDAAVTTIGTTKSLMAYLKGVLTWIGTVVNTGGTATLGALIGDFANVSLVTRLASLEVATATGSTDIDDSAQTETTAFPILTLAPAAGCPLSGVEVYLDLAKATSGFAAIESSVTVQFRVARKIDGTNWRGEAYQEAALSGTNAAGRMAKLTVGNVGVTEQARIEAVFSGDVTADMSLPYAVTYKSRGAPTITPVVAG